MRDLRPLAVVLTALAIGPDAMASPELARSRNCVACHHAERRMIGPPYNAIAARYANDPTAVRTLTQRIIEGSGGNWGQLPMPAQPGLTPEDAEALVRWILTPQ
jgi:cytochrome c